MSDAFAAIDAIRRGATGRALDRAIAALYGWLDARYSRKKHHSDLRQITIVKVARGAERCLATDRRTAEAWLRRIYVNAERDRLRARGADPLARAVDVVETPLAAADPAPAYDPDALEACEEWLFDALDDWLEATVTHAGRRQRARTHAEVAWERHVQEASPDALLEQLSDPPNKATLYKWVERGREKVWLPLLDALLAQELPTDRRRYCEQLRDILKGARRADAGRPRPSRRKGAAVSPAQPPSSVQYDDDARRTDPEGGPHD